MKRPNLTAEVFRGLEQMAPTFEQGTVTPEIERALRWIREMQEFKRLMQSPFTGEQK